MVLLVPPVAVCCTHIASHLPVDPGGVLLPTVCCVWWLPLCVGTARSIHLDSLTAGYWSGQIGR